MPRNWKRAKNSLIKERANAFIEARMAECSIVTPSMRNVLNGGTKIPLGRQDAIDLTEPPISSIKGGEITKDIPVPNVSPICPNKMRAIDAARIAYQDPLCTTKEILLLIPEYKAALPRRSWIAKFRSALDPQNKRFIDLV